MGLTQWLAMSSPTVTAEQFQAMDTNKDGVVTLEEQQAWVAQQAAMGAPAPQYRTEYVPQQKTIQRTVMTKQQVPKTVQKTRMIPKFEWEQRIVSAPRVIEVPKVTTSQIVGQQVVGTEILDQSKLASGAYGNNTTSPQSAVLSGSFVSASPPGVVVGSTGGVVVGSSTNLFATNDGTQAAGGASVADI